MNPQDEFEALFAPMETPTPLLAREPWPVLLVDDEPDVHAILKLNLEGALIEEAPLELMEARSTHEALTLLAERPDTALMLLDVVMETHEAGLELVRHIREVLGNQTLQIILVTGQPGFAPRRAVMSDYRINGYCLKSELTADRIFALACSGLRAYAMMRTLESQRAALEASEARYKALNADLEARVMRRTADLELANAELRRARDAAQRANQAKSAFLANMSHELRTPLNAVLGFTQLTRRDQRTPEDLKGNLEIVYKNGQHLLSLINDVLEIAQLEVGRMRTRVETVNLHGLLEEVLAVIRPEARAKRLVLRIEHLTALPDNVTFDVNKARQILLNLLSNAVKYTERGEVVLGVGVERVEAGERRVLLNFHVRDTGVGIEAEALEAIFQPFYQASYGARLGQGVGLGLSISQERARLLGGAIEVESALGEGSTFQLSLPAEATPPPTLRRPEEHPLLSISVEEPPLILIVDRDKDNRRLFERVLMEVGFRTRQASSEAETLAEIRAHQPQVILLDTRGSRLIEGLRAWPLSAEIPLVALTTSIFEEEERAFLERGCVAVLRKPIEEAALMRCLSELLGIALEPRASRTVTQPPPPLDLSVIPAEARAALCASAELLDVSSTRAIIAQFEDDLPGIAARLRRLVDAYRFDQLLAACEACR